jgi:hypothetical protein
MFRKVKQKHQHLPKVNIVHAWNGEIKLSQIMKGYSLDNEYIQNNFLKKLYLSLTDTYDCSSSSCQYGHLTFLKAYFR